MDVPPMRPMWERYYEIALEQLSPKIIEWLEAKYPEWKTGLYAWNLRHDDLNLSGFYFQLEDKKYFITYTGNCEVSTVPQSWIEKVPL